MYSTGKQELKEDGEYIAYNYQIQREVKEHEEWMEKMANQLGVPLEDLRRPSRGYLPASKANPHVQLMKKKSKCGSSTKGNDVQKPTGTTGKE